MKNEILLAQLKEALNASETSDSSQLGRAVQIIIELDKANADEKNPQRATNKQLSEYGLVVYKSLNNIRSLARFDALNEFVDAGYSMQKILKLKQYKSVSNIPSTITPTTPIGEIMKTIANNSASIQLDKYDRFLKTARIFFDGSPDLMPKIIELVEEQKTRDIQKKEEEDNKKRAEIDAQIASLMAQRDKI